MTKRTQNLSLFWLIAITSRIQGEVWIMRKKILILGHSHVSQFVDVYNQYARLFNPQFYEVTICYLSGPPNPEIETPNLAEHVFFLHCSKKSIRNLKIKPIIKLFRFCRAQAFDMVICHRYKPTYIMLWVAQFLKIPAIFFVMHELGTMRSRARQFLLAALRRKNMIFAGVSDSVRDDMRKDLWGIPNERITTLYNMVDFDLFEPQLLSRAGAREALHLPHSAFLFGNIGRLVVNKDHHSLILAFAKIQPFCLDAKLVIIGSGELEPMLRAQVNAMGLNDAVIFTGFVSGAFRYMKALDCFLLTSVQEAFGRVLLEAMIAKVPIIASQTHGIPEVIGGVGTLVSPKNSLGFAQAMQRCYEASHEERARQGQACYEHALSNFSIPKFHEQFWQTYTRLVN